MLRTFGKTANYPVEIMRTPFLKLFVACASVLAVSPAQPVSAQTTRMYVPVKKDLDLSWLTQSKDLWTMTPDDLEKKVGSNHFVWQDKERTRARFDPEEMKLLVDGQTVGETLISFKQGKAAAVTISIINKGDDDIIDRSAYTDAVTKATKTLQAGAGTGVREEPRAKNEQVTKAKSSIWRAPHALYLLEHLFLEQERIVDGGWIFLIREHAEFVRVRILPPTKSLGEVAVQTKTNVTRAQLAAMVKREGKKAVIEGIPMVDQGPKGYCAVASFERILRYYGADVDMHDLANLANTYGGTNPMEMKEAIHKIAVKLGMATREPFFMKGKNYEQLGEIYNRVAKKAGKSEVSIAGDVSGLFEKMDSATLKELRAKSADFAKFKTEVVSSINRGVPLLWGLHLGMFWEDKLEESFEANIYAKSTPTGTKDKTNESIKKSKDAMEAELRKSPRPPAGMQGGHMRIIIGYDGGAGTIFYTDSWGPGHEVKQMNIEDAFTGTQALMVLEPR